MPDSPPPLPTFLIIGAQKGGTRWLRSNLGEHPEIYTASDELWFFNDVARRFSATRKGVAWYREQFAGWNGEPVIGEATPGYMMWRHDPAVVAARIEQVVPDARLIAVLRNPIDRAYSAMIHHIRRGRFPADADLLDLVRTTPPEMERKGLIAGGWYAASLRPFHERFGDQLLVVLNDDISLDAHQVFAAAARHVGASPDFSPRDLERVRFSNQSGPSRTRPRRLTVDERHDLYAYFRDDIAALEELLDRDLSAWDPAVGAATD